MKDNLTEMVFVLDRSGSMDNLVDDTIGGFNSLIEKQKEIEGEAKVSLFIFDDKYDTIYLRKNVQEVPILDRSIYFARGMTALNDAIGKTINIVENELSNLPEKERPSKVIFCITTDGLENASKEYTTDKIKEMITHQEENYNWEFLFLGANIDAFATGSGYGVSNINTVQYDASKKGTKSLYNSVNSRMVDTRKDVEVKSMTEYYKNSTSEVEEEKENDKYK